MQYINQALDVTYDGTLGHLSWADISIHQELYLNEKSDTTRIKPIAAWWEHLLEPKFLFGYLRNLPQE